jgi:hypothetical protein
VRPNIEFLGIVKLPREALGMVPLPLWCHLELVKAHSRPFHVHVLVLSALGDRCAEVLMRLGIESLGTKRITKGRLGNDKLLSSGTI